MSILFLKTSQGYSGGYKYGVNARLIDEDGKTLFQIKGGGFDIKHYLFRKWALTNYASQLGENAITEHGTFETVRDQLGYIGVILREVRSPVSGLYVFEVTP